MVINQETLQQELQTAAFGIEQIIDEIPGLGELKDLIQGDYGGALLSLIPFGKKGKALVEGTSDVSKQLKKAEQRAAKLSKKQRPGEKFTKAGKEAVIDVNKAKNGDKTIFETCGTETIPAKRDKKGVSPPKNRTEIDHIKKRRNGGSGTPDNGRVRCRNCNNSDR